MRLTDAVPIIKQAVSAVDAAAALGLQPNRYGRVACPIHGGHGKNMKLFDGDKGYYCFVCHAGGDVINMTQKVLGCGLNEAVAWLSDTFRLGLDRDSPDNRKALRDAQEAARKRQEAQARRDEERRKLQETRLNALSLSMELDALIEKYRPRRYSEEWADEFVAALNAREELRSIEEEIDITISRSEERRHP